MKISHLFFLVGVFVLMLFLLNQQNERNHSYKKTVSTNTNLPVGHTAIRK